MTEEAKLEAMAAQQERMAQQIVIPTEGEGWLPQAGDLVLTLDVQYTGDTGFVAIDSHRWQQGGGEIFAVNAPVTEPYVPGYFAFREGPVLLYALEKVVDWMGERPALVIVDGHGTAHPRRFGVACWLGLQLELPVIGCAKETLVQFAGELDEPVGSRVPVLVEGEVVGYALRTALGVKPVFVSPGHKVSLTTSADVILALGGGYRIIEPLRRADQACRAYAKGEHGLKMTYLD